MGDSFFQDEKLFQDEELVEPPHFEVEYEHCNERDDCGMDDHEKDNGLDSTLSFSIADGYKNNQIHERY